MAGRIHYELIVWAGPALECHVETGVAVEAEFRSNSFQRHARVAHEMERLFPAKLGQDAGEGRSLITQQPGQRAPLQPEPIANLVQRDVGQMVRPDVELDPILQPSGCRNFSGSAAEFAIERDPQPLVAVRQAIGQNGARSPMFFAIAIIIS